MRRLNIAAVAALSLAAASLLGGSRAEALPGFGGLGAAGDSGVVQDVRYVCRPVWNGFRWVQQCYWVRPRFVRPYPYYYGGPRVRPYPYYARPRPYIY